MAAAWAQAGLLTQIESKYGSFVQTAETKAVAHPDCAPIVADCSDFLTKVSGIGPLVSLKTLTKVLSVLSVGADTTATPTDGEAHGIARPLGQTSGNAQDIFRHHACKRGDSALFGRRFGAARRA
jgi:hypothetical protein